MALTDTKIRQTKPKKTFKLADEKGLYLEGHPNCSSYWRRKFRFNKKEKRMALGVSPEITLKEARLKRDQSRKLLADKIDPNTGKKSNKNARAIVDSNNFETVARQWYAKTLRTWATSPAKKRLALLENDFFPWLGNRPISEINALELLQKLRRIEARGALTPKTTNHRLAITEPTELSNLLVKIDLISTIHKPA